jgi:hypothetical protein
VVPDSARPRDRCASVVIEDDLFGLWVDYLPGSDHHALRVVAGMDQDHQVVTLNAVEAAAVASVVNAVIDRVIQRGKADGMWPDDD